MIETSVIKDLRVCNTWTNQWGGHFIWGDSIFNWLKTTLMEATALSYIGCIIY